MTIRLVILQEALALSHLAVAFAGSVLLHGGMVAALWCYSAVSPNEAGQILPQTSVQLLRLVPTQQAVLVTPNPSIHWRPEAEPAVPDRGSRNPAPETLRVGGALSEAHLQQALPLPAAAAWTGVHTVSSATDLVRLSTRNEPADAGDLTFLPIPRVDIISLPDIALPDADVPVVNQEAASNGSGPVIQSSETPPSSSSTGAATPASALDSTLDPTLTRIELPGSSRPSVTLLGESVAGQYPGIANQVPARVVSTIYLRMGLKKSWFLEYWTPQLGQKGGPTLDAPWPYLMWRPKLEFSPGENVVFVRGILTSEGRLQNLSLLLPPHWSHQDHLLEALAHWQFRPASRNGQPLPVEVLLVIPRQPEE